MQKKAMMVVGLVEITWMRSHTNNDSNAQVPSLNIPN